MRASLRRVFVVVTLAWFIAGAALGIALHEPDDGIGETGTESEDQGLASTVLWGLLTASVWPSADVAWRPFWNYWDARHPERRMPDGAIEAFFAVSLAVNSLLWASLSTPVILGCRYALRRLKRRQTASGPPGAASGALP